MRTVGGESREGETRRSCLGLRADVHRQPPFGCAPRYPFRIPLHYNANSAWPPPVLSFYNVRACDLSSALEHYSIDGNVEEGTSVACRLAKMDLSG